MDIARDFFGVDPKSLAIIIFIWIVISLWLFGDHGITPGIVLIGTLVTIWFLRQFGPLLLTIIAVIVFTGFVFLAFLAKLGRKSPAPLQPYKPPVSSTPFGAFEHKLHQHLLSEKLKKDGLDAKIEDRIKGSGKSIDVLVQSVTEGYISYEITHNFSNLISNIEDDFEAGASRVVIVTKDDTGMAKAENIVRSAQNLAQYNNFISFQKISDFFA